MSTIALYSENVNQMTNMITGVKKAVNVYKNQLSIIQKKVLKVNSNICNLDEVTSIIQASSIIQKDKINALDTFKNAQEQFVQETVRIDNEVSIVIVKNKNKFYEKYNYLKPEFEKNVWDRLKDGLESADEWCRENWESIAKIGVAVGIIVILAIGTIATAGTLATILGGALLGALVSSAIGGILGGIASLLSEGNFIKGFADGMLSGTITGAITGAIGGVGTSVGKAISCKKVIGKIIKVTSKVSTVLSGAMDTFDMTTGILTLFDIDNFLTQWNEQLHSFALYNKFQMLVGVTAVFTSSASNVMRCFVAGTMVLTATGFLAIEKVKVGDWVMSAEQESLRTSCKKVVQIFQNECSTLAHLIVNGEEIVSTATHPFYVVDKGWIKAGNLLSGDKLVNCENKVFLVENVEIERLEKPVKVYNFEVEDNHSYYVGKSNILVHNNCEKSPDEIIEEVKNGKIKLITRKRKGNFGEMCMHKLLKAMGYDIISKNPVTGLNDPTHQGIDGLYYKKNGHPPFIIAEAKYTTKCNTAKLSKTKHHGTQMSDRWIRFNLKKEVLDVKEYQLLMTKFLNGDMAKLLVNVGPDGSCIVKQIMDKSAKSFNTINILN